MTETLRGDLEPEKNDIEKAYSLVKYMEQPNSTSMILLSIQIAKLISSARQEVMAEAEKLAKELRFLFPDGDDEAVKAVLNRWEKFKAAHKEKS